MCEKSLETISLKKGSFWEKTTPSDTGGAVEALYLYCVGDSAIEVSLGNIGIEQNMVYSILYRDISAVVHKCLPEPYQSNEEETVKEWILAHQRVVDVAWKKFGTVLPSGFDTIIKGNETVSAEENLKKWLEENYEKLKDNLERVEGKAEVGVQIFLDRKVVAHAILETSEEIKGLNKEMKEKSPGMAYFYKQKIQRVLKRELEGKADEYFRDFYGRITKYTNDVRVEKTKKTESDEQMIMNLSLLIQKDKIKLLGEELVIIKEVKGVEARFTGPWPPYSFVTPA